MKYTTHFFTFLILFVASVMFLMMPVSAFGDDVQRYTVDFEEVWTVSTSGGGTYSSSVTKVNSPVAYMSSRALYIYSSAKGKMNYVGASASSSIQSINLIDSSYIAFRVDTATTTVAGNGGVATIKVYYINESDVTLATKTILTGTDTLTDNFIELVRSGNHINMYNNGVYVDQASISGSEDVYIKFTVSCSSPGHEFNDYQQYAYIKIDDITTSSILGMNEQWTQADTNIDISYGVQSQSSFPTDEYTIKVTRPSTSETINTTSLGTGATGTEAGFVRWNRNNIFGSNFGLYQATLYRESDVLTNTYFSIFDTTIQGSVDWEKYSYTIDESPALGYSITNGDLSVYTYTLRVIDSLQQIKESYTLNSYSGIKGPNLAGYSTGTYYAVLSRKNKATSKVDDFAFDTVEISAEGIDPSSYINFGLDQYTIGDTASYTFNWAEDDTSFWTRERIVIEKDGIILDRMNAELSGTRYLDMDELGRYSISLISYGLFTYGNPVVHVSDSVECIEPLDGYINVPQTAPQRTNFTVNYLYGSTPSNGLILIKRLDETTGIYETVEFDLLGDDKQGGTSYSMDMSLHSTGTYKITLIHDEQVDEIYDVIKITSLYVPPIKTVGNSSINSDKFTYAIGETIFAQYAVDYTNFTTYNVNMEIYNIDKDIISYSVPTIDQISYISQTIHISNEYFIGSHVLRLTSYDNTGTKVAVLADKNITVGLVDDGGFGLSLSKYDVMQLELFVIKAISPTSANIRVRSVERDTQVGSLITINGSTYLNYAIPCAGNYEITLSSGGFEIVKQYITVHEGLIDGDEEEDITEEDIAFDTKFESMLSSGSFIALLIIIACVGAFGKIGGVVGVFLGMIVGITISFLMGYLPEWILFIMVLALCVVFVSKLIDSFGGGE